MKELDGTVIEVFIPEQYKNDVLLDVMDRNLIGFKVQTDEGIKEVIQEADEENANILKGDSVLLVEQVIDNQKYIDIYKGDSNEQ